MKNVENCHQIDHLNMMTNNSRWIIVIIFLKVQPVLLRRIKRRKDDVCLLTNEDTAMSAKERYLVRKRAKLSQPTISTDDPLNL